MRQLNNFEIYKIMITTQQLLQFIQNHWTLCLAFGAVLIFIIFEEFKNKIGDLSKISAQDMMLLLNREKAITIDLRNKKAFDSSHILNSINIEHKDFDGHLKKIDSHKNRPVILISDNDINTSSIGSKLKKHGFTKIYILAGGIQTWKNAQLPLTKN